MQKPIPLESLFKEKIFRIPDYQSGYAWQEEHFQAFWEDLVNLPEGQALGEGGSREPIGANSDSLHPIALHTTRSA